MFERISGISDWVSCEGMALHDPRLESRTHVAAHVGTMAHALLAGLPPPPEPKRLRYDRITPARWEADMQAKALAWFASDMLRQRGWAVLEKESEVFARAGLVGHIDIVAYHEKLGEAVIDLKTGRQIGAGWLQVGGYLDALGHGAYGGILHVPRATVGSDLRGELEVRPAEGLRAAWRRRLARIDEVIAGAAPLLSPGGHCPSCKITCPVRQSAPTS